MDLLHMYVKKNSSDQLCASYNILPYYMYMNFRNIHVLIFTSLSRDVYQVLPVLRHYNPSTTGKMMYPIQYQMYYYHIVRVLMLEQHLFYPVTH